MAHSQLAARTLVNPRPEHIRLVLSDGSERVVLPWGLTLLPRSTPDGDPLEIVEAQLWLSPPDAAGTSDSQD
jgi:hypothetical protein